MKKLASFVFALLSICITLMVTGAPANAQALAGFADGGATGSGPRVDFGTVNDPDQYMIVGAYDDINNIDTRNRPLKIYSGSKGGPIVIVIDQLPDISTAAPGADLKTLAIDAKTGQLYVGYAESSNTGGGTQVSNAKCFWMENYTGRYTWVDAPQGNVSKQECYALDSCDGGLGQSGGGCYKWAESADAPRIPWG